MGKVSKAITHIKDEKDYEEVSSSQFAQSIHNPTPATTTIMEASELGDVLKYMTEDIVELDKSMTSIDMKTRLGNMEISGILAVDFLIGSSFLPLKAIALTRMKKRLAISKNGEGRKEAVAIVVGKRQEDALKTGIIANKPPQ
jgi:hypothetical protein